MFLAPPAHLFRIAAHSDVGQRQNNEDSFLVNPDIGLFLVADGMGGHERGEIASRFSAERLEKIVAGILSPDASDTLDDHAPGDGALSTEEALQLAFFSINRQLFEENRRRREEALAAMGEPDPIAGIRLRKQSMGTTLVSALFTGRNALVANIGDSRAYLWRAGALRQITRDHSWVEEELRAGRLTAAQAQAHAKRNVITRSLGNKPEVNADIDLLAPLPGDRFLLCSDGLSNMLDPSLLAEFLRQPDPDAAIRAMVDLAKERGGRDNITALLVEVVDFKPGARDITLD